MADYAITGKKGNGKTLFAAGLIRDALVSGKKVATNLDIFVEHLGYPFNRSVLLRLPDRPTVADFERIGRGQEGVNEDENGIIVLDETSTFFNTRTWGDKARQPIIDWLVHSRKLGWDVYYIMQGLIQVDKQIRDTQIEYHISVRRTDKWPIPFLSPIFALFGIDLRFPKFHIGVIRQGTAADSLKIETKWFRARDIYKVYDTQQLFLDRDHPKACGLHSVLSAYHVKGRYMSWWQKTKPLVASAAAMSIILGAILGAGGLYLFMNRNKVNSTSVSKVLPMGYIIQGGKQMMLFENGHILPVEESKIENGVVFYRNKNIWYPEKKQ